MRKIPTNQEITHKFGCHDEVPIKLSRVVRCNCIILRLECAFIASENRRPAFLVQSISYFHPSWRRLTNSQCTHESHVSC